MPFGCVRGCWRWRLGCSAVDALEREDRVSNPHPPRSRLVWLLRGIEASSRVQSSCTDVDSRGPESGKGEGQSGLVVSLRAARLPTMAVTPTQIGEAARDGRTEFVLEALARAEWPVGPAGGLMLVVCCGARPKPDAPPPHDIQSKHIDLARALLDRGADPNLRKYPQWTPLNYAAQGHGDCSVDMVALLLDAGGADPVSLFFSLLLAIRGFEASDPARDQRCRRIVRLLLRSGDVPLSELTVDQLTNFFSNHAGVAATQGGFLSTRQLIVDVHAAGSPRAYRMLRRKQVLLLRSLALKGRAEPRDARMTFLVESPNEIAWKVLEYWRTELDC